MRPPDGYLSDLGAWRACVQTAEAGCLDAEERLRELEAELRSTRRESPARSDCQRAVQAAARDLAVARAVLARCTFIAETVERGAHVVSVSSSDDPWWAHFRQDDKEFFLIGRGIALLEGKEAAAVIDRAVQEGRWISQPDGSIHVFLK